jgi:nucleoside-diphosphate-sugar epimerase
LDEAQIERSVEGCTHVLHIANPVPGGPKLTYDAFVPPVEKGTQAMVDACHKHGVKTLVVTSSVVAMHGSFWKKKEKGQDHVVYDEKDRCPLGVDSFYVQSKAA